MWGTGGRPGSGPELNVTGGKFKDGALNVGGGIFAKVDEEVDDNRWMLWCSQSKTQGS